jgi:hypothetical protein
MPRSSTEAQNPTAKVSGAGPEGWVCPGWC